MTLPRKGSRRIRVGEAEYVWRIRGAPTYLQAAFASPMTLAIQHRAAGAQSLLMVNLGVSRPDNWISPHQTAVTPAVVREIIAAALSQGWQPLDATEPFFLDHALIRDRA